MHSLLLLASLLATPAPVMDKAPLIPERPLLMKGEIARLDPYGGWRDDSRSAPELLSLLREQNRWTEQQLAGQQPLAEKLQAEWQTRERGEPMPAEWLSQAGSQWRMDADGRLWQRSDEQAAPRQRLAQRQPAEGYYELAAWSLHPNGRWLALAEDSRGDRDYRITLLDLESGETVATLPHRASDLLWSLDGKTLYTIANERHTLRPWQLSHLAEQQPRRLGAVPAG